MTHDITIRRAIEADSLHLSRMLLGQSEAYMKYFRPFSFNEEMLRAKLSAAKNDCYWLLAFGELFGGLFMLRGFDAGYEIPSFGVVIAESYSGLGLSSLSLNYAISWCAANRVPKLMLKVHPDNLKAKKIYESFGFAGAGVDTKNGNIVMHYNLHGRVR